MSRGVLESVESSIPDRILSRETTYEGKKIAAVFQAWTAASAAFGSVDSSNGFWAANAAAHSVTYAARATDCAQSYEIEETPFDEHPHKFSTNQDMFRAVSIDLSSMSFENPLWPDNTAPGNVLESHRDFLSILNNKSGPWLWWRDWYLGIWNGTPTDWDFALEVAKLDWDAPKGESVWDTGPGAVAERIEELRRLRATDLTPRLVQREGAWDVEVESVPDEPLEFAVGQVELALSSALKLCSPNLFNESSDEAVMISEALESYRNNHSLLAVRFYEACMSFNKRIGAEYPEDDAHLVGLQNALYTSVEEMCVHNSTIKARVGRVAILNTRRLPNDEDRAELEKLPPTT